MRTGNSRDPRCDRAPQIRLLPSPREWRAEFNMTFVKALVSMTVAPKVAAPKVGDSMVDVQTVGGLTVDVQTATSQAAYLC